MKSVLLNAHKDGGWESRFQVALDVARAFDSHLSCIQVIPYQLLVTGEAFGPSYAATDLYESLHEQARQHQAAVEGRLGLENVTWDWFRCDGDSAQGIIDRSGLADLIVISSATGPFKNGDLGEAGEICVNARGPVLAVPARVKSFDPLGTALVAWNGSLESAHAVRLAVPMLAKASVVHVLNVVEDEEKDAFPATDACEYLARHGIASELHTRSRKDWKTSESGQLPRVADMILDAALLEEADYILIGAYGHSRFREAVFGGVTRDLLRRSEVPLLLAH